MRESARLSKVCVIGTGARGIAACRALSERGVPFDCFEKLDSVAGSLFDTAGAAIEAGCHEEANDPRICAVAEALEAYVGRFGLRSRITFGHAVEYARRLRGGSWRVHFEQGPARHYDAIFLATGCHRQRLVDTGCELLLPASLPFLDPDERRALRDGLPLWNHLIHPRSPNIFFLARMSTTRLTVSVAEEQSKFAASLIAGDYQLPSRVQLQRERRAVQQGTGQCPTSVLDMRYAFHLRRERVRRTRLHDGVTRRARAVSG